LKPSSKGETHMKILSIIVAILVTTTAAFARDNVQIAGSSTVLPYATIVAESFGENFDFPTPVVESGGSSAGLKRFCEGVGTNTIDIANASRRIKDSEREICATNGVTEITEVRIGYDGIVFAVDKSNVGFEELTVGQIYTGLTKHNSFTTWNQVDPALPNVAIMAFIPGTKHGTREVFEEKVMLAGCEEVGDYDKFLEELGDKKKAQGKCMEVSQERNIDIDGDYTEALARVASNKNGIGVFGLSFYMNNTSVLNVAKIDGVVPSQETISTGEYSISRPLYFYIKDAHLNTIPGLLEYAQFFMSNDMATEGSALVNYGLVEDPELATTQEMLNNK